MLWRILFLLCFGSGLMASPLPRSNNSPLRGPCELARDHFTTVEGLRVHYLETGAGPSLVMIHGNAGAADDFGHGTIELLCGEYRIVAVDRAGHGQSDRPKGKPATLEYQADLLHQTLTKLGVTHPILVGHSWGASLALAYALKYQTEVSAMVLIAPAAYPDSGGDRLIRMAVTPPVIGDVSLLLGRLILGRHILKKELARAFYPEPVPEEYLKHATHSWLTRRHLKSYLEDEWTLNRSLKNLSRSYSEIKVPVVIVTGDEDRVVIAKDNAYRLKSTLACADLIEVKYAGHEIPQTHPETIYAAIKKASEAESSEGHTEAGGSGALARP